MIGRKPESHLHLGQAALGLNPQAPPSSPAAAATHVALTTTAPKLNRPGCRFYKSMQVQASFHIFLLEVVKKGEKSIHRHVHEHTYRHPGVNFLVA